MSEKRKNAPCLAVKPSQRSQIPDTLWRSIRAPRGGQRGFATKVRHINEGIAQGHYRGTYPFVNQSGHSYAQQWKFQISSTVLQEATVWEIESSSSEEVQATLERPATKARPAPKPRPVDRSENSGQGQSSSSRVPKAKSGPSSGSQQFGAIAKPAAKAKEGILRPRQYLPDTVVWYDRGNKAEKIGSGPEPVGVNFEEVLDRSRTLTSLQRVKVEQTWGDREAVSIVIVFQIEHSSGNLDNLLQLCNTHRRIVGDRLVTSIFIARQRCGVTGKAATIKSYCLDYQLPCALVDDNREVIEENSEAGQINAMCA
eukprot:s754_g21.t1